MWPPSLTRMCGRSAVVLTTPAVVGAASADRPLERDEVAPRRGADGRGVAGRRHAPGRRPSPRGRSHVARRARGRPRHPGRAGASSRSPARRGLGARLGMSHGLPVVVWVRAARTRAERQPALRRRSIAAGDMDAPARGRADRPRGRRHEGRHLGGGEASHDGQPAALRRRADGSWFRVATPHLPSGGPSKRSTRWRSGTPGPWGGGGPVAERPWPCIGTARHWTAVTVP